MTVLRILVHQYTDSLFTIYKSVLRHLDTLGEAIHYQAAFIIYVFNTAVKMACIYAGQKVSGISTRGVPSRTDDLGELYQDELAL